MFTLNKVKILVCVVSSRSTSRESVIFGSEALEKVSMFPAGYNSPLEVFDSPGVRSFLAS